MVSLFGAVLTLASAVSAAENTLYIATVPPTETTAIANAYRPASTLALDIATTALPAGTLQWLHDEQPIPAATARKLTLTNLSTADAGNYRLRVTDGASVTHSNTIVVNLLPVTPSAVDTSFVSRLPATFKVAGVTAFAADGSFIALSSDTATAPVRVAADGTVVAGFNYPLSAGAILAGFSDGRLLTEKAPYLLAADGSPLTFALPAAFDSSKPLTSAGIAADGRFYLSQGTTVVRCLADGTVDPTFTFSTTVDSSTTVLAVDRLGRPLLRGVRIDPDTSHYPRAWDWIYRLNLDGSADRTFLTVGEMKGDVGRGAVLGDGRIIAWSSYEGFRTWHVFNEDGSEVAGYTGNFFNDRFVHVDPLHADVYSLALSLNGGVERRHFGLTSLALDDTFYAGVTGGYSLPSFAADPAGKLLFFTNTDSWEGHATQNLARIRTDVPRPVLPPSASISTSTSSPRRGDTVTLTAQTSADGTYTYQWLALDGQPLPATTTASTLVIPNFSATHLGRYQLRVSGSFGSVLSGVIALQLDDNVLTRPYLANLSGRAVPGTGEDTVIGGFTTKIYSGAVPVPLLLRAVGPSLKDFGVANYLPNPALNLSNLAGSVVANNDNWSDSPDHEAIRTAAAATGAFALAEGSLDAALLKVSYNEQFTAQLFGQTGTTGVGLLEIYRRPSDLLVGELTNLSLRARTGPGDAVAIAGFVITDPQNFDRTARVLLRVVGPKLADYGIQHPLADPVLTLYNAKGEVVRRVDNWSDDTDATALAATMKQVGAFDLQSGSKDAAVVLDLPAGAYTLHATGGEGVTLLEIYIVR